MMIAINILIVMIILQKNVNIMNEYSEKSGIFNVVLNAGTYRLD